MSKKNSVKKTRAIKNLEEYSQKTSEGAALFNEKQYSKALPIFLELAEYNAKNYKVYETLALIYLKLNEVEKADEALKTAMSLYSEKNNVKFSIKTPEETIAQWEKVEKLEEIYTSRLSEKTKTKKAKDNEEAGSQENDKDENYSLHRLPVMIGMQYMVKGEYKKAEELLMSHKKKFFVK